MSSNFKNGFCPDFGCACVNSYFTEGADGTQPLQEQPCYLPKGYISESIIQDVLKILEVDNTEELLVAADAQPRVIKVALDSGAGDHVASPSDLEGFMVEESPGSKAGRHFVAANGSRIQNQGQVTAQMSHTKLGTSFGSTFQMANVSRPLYSVSKMCDMGAQVTIDAKKALVYKNGKLLARFERQGGLYLAEFTVMPRKPTAGFTGQGPAQ